ncbi:MULTISPECIES: hypothetical protein [Prosthecochloris]|uniref:hypothetical protein n=1 Tax=Prosthecochloris TaxID=1101 RepID=UPI001EFD39A9|nr:MULTISPECIES: hypothetical protein [Prosthecochloris]UZJ38428.1 hypothetical protein OO005_04290 [Prosthecochloris sp. SCSIO W1103]
MDMNTSLENDRQIKRSMKKMTASQQKLLKVFHLITASIWLSSVIALALLPIISSPTATGDEVYMYNLAYHFIDMFILTPAAVLTLITGLIYSLFTKWGFFQHGWLIYKWIVSLLIVITGTLYFGPLVTELLEIADLKRVAALEDRYYMQGHTIGLFAAIVNSSLLIVAVVVSVYKPWKNVRK